MKTISQQDFDKYLTSEIAGFSFDAYTESVWEWVNDLIDKEMQNNENTIFSNLIRNCYESSIITIDCAKYLVDKFCGEGKSSDIKLKFDPQKLITNVSLFKEIESEKIFVLNAKLSKDFFMIRSMKRTRTHRELNNYELRKVHMSKLNLCFILLKY